MTLLELYKFSESIMEARVTKGEQSVAVPVIDLVEKLKSEITWIEDINTIPVAHKDGDPLGHYELHGNRESRWDEDNAWVVLISYNRHFRDTSNLCHIRYVCSKELMHIFDTKDGQISDTTKFKTLLSEIEFQPPPENRSAAYWAENSAFWKALLVLCPKKFRDDIKVKWESKEYTDFDVALHFRIPEELVGALFSDGYDMAHDTYLK